MVGNHLASMADDDAAAQDDNLHALTDQTPGHRITVGVHIARQTGATSEHSVQRRVHTYGDYIDIDKLRARVTELNAAGKMDKEIASVLNAEGFLAAQNCAFKGDNVWLLRRRWGIPTVKINGTSPNPFRWPDGTYSIQGAAAALGITPQTIFKYLARGLIQGRQLVKGQPWQIELTEDQINILRARAQRNRRSRKQAS